MKFGIMRLVLSFILIIFCTTLVSGDECIKCPPGRKSKAKGHILFKDPWNGCNTCVCKPNGVYSCNRMFCPGKTEHEGGTCPRGFKWMIENDCRICFCYTSGAYACILKTEWDAQQERNAAAKKRREEAKG